MKKRSLFSLALLFFGVLFVQESLAQSDNPFGLPEGALARLGKGSIGEGDRAVSYSPDGTRLAVASNIGIWLYNAATGAAVALLTGHSGKVNWVVFSPDGHMLASGGGWPNTVRLWDVSTGQELAALEGHTDWVTSVSFSPDGQTLASGGSGEFTGRIRLWDVSTGQELANWGYPSSVTSVSYSPDGQTLAYGGGWPNTVRLWDVSTGQGIATLEGHTDWVTSVSFSPDGRTLASGSWDRTIRLWDVSTGQELGPPSKAIRIGSRRCPFRRMVRSWPVAVRTRRFVCGTCPLVRS